MTSDLLKNSPDERREERLRKAESIFKAKTSLVIRLIESRMISAKEFGHELLSNMVEFLEKYFPAGKLVREISETTLRKLEQLNLLLAIKTAKYVRSIAI